MNSEAEFAYVDGDGTVPVESAMADGLNAKARVGIPADHRGILLDEHFFHIIKHWLEVGGADSEYDPETDYVIVSRRPSEFDIHKEESAPVDDIERTEDGSKLPSKEVYTASIEIGSGSVSDIQAEADARVHREGAQTNESEFQLSTIGVFPGLDKKRNEGYS